jgi:hypothetical protein
MVEGKKERVQGQNNTPLKDIPPVIYFLPLGYTTSF